MAVFSGAITTVITPEKTARIFSTHPDPFRSKIGSNWDNNKTFN